MTARAHAGLCHTFSGCIYTTYWPWRQGRITFPKCELNSLDEHSRSRHHKHGTLSLLTLDPALPYIHLNAISKPTFSLILNWRHKRLCIPRKTLWRYTNVVLLLLLLLLSLRSPIFLYPRSSTRNPVIIPSDDPSEALSVSSKEIHLSKHAKISGIHCTL